MHLVLICFIIPHLRLNFNINSVNVEVWLIFNVIKYQLEYIMDIFLILFVLILIHAYLYIKLSSYSLMYHQIEKLHYYSYILLRVYIVLLLASMQTQLTRKLMLSVITLIIIYLIYLLCQCLINN